MYDNPSWYFLKNFLIGFVVSLILMAFLPPVATPLIFLTLNGMFMATATLDFFFRKRRNPDGTLITTKDWLIRYILFGVIIGIGLYLMGGLRTFPSIAFQSIIFLLLCSISFPPFTTKWNKWIEKQVKKNKQLRFEFEQKQKDLQTK